MSTPWLPDEMINPARLSDAQSGPVKDGLALLINPFYSKDPYGSFGKHVLAPSLALTSIAGATPSPWELEYWDENLLQGHPPCDPIPQVVGITVHLTFSKRAYELSEWYRGGGAKVILGGPHVIACPDEALAHADAVCVGDGVQAWPIILDDINRGKLKKIYRGDYRQSFRNDPPPRRDILPRESFLTTLSVMATRGCKNRCDFCYLSTKDLRMNYQAREIEQVVEEFTSSGEPYGVFIDNNLGSDRKYLRRLCRALAPLNKTWSAAVTLDVTDEPSLVREMALAGCTGVFIGLETLSDKNLAEANKRCPRASDYGRRVRIFQRNGIHVNGSFVFGFDNDRKDVFRKTIDWIEENRLACATFHILTPYPGTPLFKRMEAEGRLLHNDWTKYDTAHTVFRPKHMTPEELEEGYAYCYRRLFSAKSIWVRRPKGISATAAYLAMTWLYKRSNKIWHYLIRYRFTAAVWRPLLKYATWRHKAHRRKLAQAKLEQAIPRPTMPVSAGV